MDLTDAGDVQHLQSRLCICAFDSAKPTFRHEQFEDYKAHRPPMPEELRGQVDLAKKLLDHLGIPHIAVDGVEADDLIGAISKKAKNWNVEYLILTGDRDSLQLVDETCNVLLTKKGISEIIRYDAAKIKEDFDLTPEQVVDYKGLVGDPSDNIPVSWAWNKTATKLLAEFVLDNILKPRCLRRAEEARAGYGTVEQGV